jgi:ATP-dependent RNA helicase DeaD
VEIAAAAMELLEEERAKPRAAANQGDAAPRDGMVRLFFSVGARDGLRTGEVLATIGNDAGIPGSEVGKIDIRDSHSIVEVSPASASAVVEKLNGKTMAGRRLVVRPDQDAGERPATGTRGRESGARRDSTSRPAARGGARSSFSGERRPSRADGPSRPAAGRERPRPGRPRTGGDKP